jgi:hypothetical protein
MGEAAAKVLSAFQVVGCLCRFEGEERQIMPAAPPTNAQLKWIVADLAAAGEKRWSKIVESF